MMLEMNVGARFCALSIVLPRVITVVGSAMIAFSILEGRGVVVISFLGRMPTRRPRLSMSSASGCGHVASSSQYARSCCGPLNRSGSSALKQVA